MMTSKEIRQSYLDFFREKQHAIVPSSSLLPDSPNLLFTNAGMNQFVPIFLGQTSAPYKRAADTQKCIRAGGKHNDLEDVGLDTYHHTFFEMLGNWSFGDYFKKEAIDWAWELVVKRWGFPSERVYATYFRGEGNIAEDTEAKELWLRYLPADHVVPGNRKDNFWMMGDTGPCGPCSELHIDLTPAGNGGAKLVNAGSPQCIEIWNLVFIQFNANPDGSLTPLPAKHVDTGMGFERVTSMIQCTNGFQDFTRPISNYETDVFTPIFRELEKLSGKKYGSSLQDPGDIAFRVIADHIRCLSFAIADGIAPSNDGRGYVIRRILRRAVRYGRTLGFHEPFLHRLVSVVAANFGETFPELRLWPGSIEKVIQREEDAFNRTLDRGITLFDMTVAFTADGQQRMFPAKEAFMLYDTFGFPLDLTELMARERGYTVDIAGFERLMEEQRLRAREDHAKKKSVIQVASEGIQVTPTVFLGYDNEQSEAIIEAVSRGQKSAEFEIVCDRTPFYAEMGGQVGDTGWINLSTHTNSGLGRLEVIDTQRQGNLHIHRAVIESGRDPEVGETVWLGVNHERRANIQRHHTVTHLFHWALHEVVSKDARQRGSLVAPDRLRFDFNYPERLTEQQLADIERLVNERIQENSPVSWIEVPYADIRGNTNVMQFFGDKYGDVVRVVQIGGHAGKLDGYSMELCGGTHTRTTGDIALFKITKESAIAAGIRRLEAVVGEYARQFIAGQSASAQAEADKAKAREQEKELAKQRQSAMQSQAPAIAEKLLAEATGTLIVSNLGDANADMLRSVVDALKPKFASGIVVLGGVSEGKVALICYVTPDMVKAGKHAGKIVGELAKICGGGGGGKADTAQAGGKLPEKLPEALAAVERLA